MNQELYKARAKIAKSLAHEARLKIVSVLAEQGDTCACEFVEFLDLSQPSVSRHLSVLKDAGVISSKKEGLNVIYKLQMQCIANFFSCIDDVLLAKVKNRQKELGIKKE